MLYYTAKILRAFAYFLLMLFIVFISGLSVTTVNTGCKTSEVTEDDVLDNQELTTMQEVQNIVGAPLRYSVGIIFYPIKAIFYDFPNAIADAFTSELTSYKDKLQKGTQKEKEDALFFLSYHKNPDAWKIVTIAFEDKEPDIRKQAVIAISRIKPAPKESADLLLKLYMNETDASVLVSIVYALGKVGSENHIYLLKALFNDKNESEVVRSFALLSLAELGAPDVEKNILEILKDKEKHPMWIANAVLALGYVKNQTDETKKILHDALMDSDQRIMISAATALGIASDLKFMKEMLVNDEVNDEIKKRLLVSLGEYGGKEEVEVLKAYLPLKNNPLRLFAVFGLAKAKFNPVIHELIQNIEDPDPWVRLWSLSFLYELTDEKFGLETKLWMDWWVKNYKDYVEPFANN